MFDLLRERGLTPAVWVSTGNQVDVDVTEVTRYLLGDPAVDTILVYLEQTPDGGEWDAVGRAAREAGKQIVALHGGATDAGRRAVASHTGALVGDRRAFELTSEANGVVLVDDLEPMIDIALARRGGAHRSGRRIAIVTTSGGAGSLAADWCERCGLEVAALSPASRTEVDAVLPPFGTSANPIDVTGAFLAAGAARMGDLCRVVSHDGNVDHVVVVLSNTVGDAAMQLAQSVVAAHPRMEASLSIVYLAAADRTVDARATLTDAGIPVFRGVADALRAIGTLAQRGQPALAAPTAPHDAAPADTGVLTVLTEVAGRALLDEVGVACPASILVDSAAEAERAASTLGGTVVLKVQSADLLHKTDVGAIAHGVKPEDAAAVYDTLVSRVRRVAPTAAIDGVLVEQRVDPGVELLVGVQGAHDGYPAVLTVGIGGTAVEIYGDIATALAPVDAGHALDLLRSLRGWPLLHGFRGSAPVDVDAAARDRGNLVPWRSLRRCAGRRRGEPAHRARERRARGRLRVPAPERDPVSAQEVVIDADGIPLSGLLAEPAGRRPRAVVLAIPGSAMLSRYFHGPVDPAGSLLDLGASAGFTVWSIDRPGYGTSADIPDDRLDIFGQAAIVHAALDTFARDRDIGAGFFVVAHSYGLKLALVMAAGVPW